MATTMKAAGINRRRFRSAITELFLTLMGGRKQRWETIRRLAQTETDEQQKRG